MGFGRLGFGLFDCVRLEMRLQVVREEKARRERRARGEPETPTVTEELLSPFNVSASLGHDLQGDNTKAPKAGTFGSPLCAGWRFRASISWLLDLRPSTHIFT